MKQGIKCYSPLLQGVRCYIYIDSILLPPNVTGGKMLQSNFTGRCYSVMFQCNILQGKRCHSLMLQGVRRKGEEATHQCVNIATLLPGS